MVLTVRIYNPFPYPIKKLNTSYNLKCALEIAILSSQTISELKDKIACVNNEVVCTELHNLEDEPLIKAKNPKDIYPSSFMFIENVFYNDYRHKDATDTSEVIRKWAKEKKIGDLKTEDMCKVIH